MYRGIIAFLCLMSVSVTKIASADDYSEIVETINNLTNGVDIQSGEQLQRAFHANAALFATSPAGDELINLSAEVFASLHEEKQFGGQERQVEIVQVDITDGLTAQAKVLAYNDQLHYTYYLSLAKLSGIWKIQNFLQRSKSVE